MSNNNNNNNNNNNELLKAQSLLQAGQKVFLHHTHSPGYLHPTAQWSGEYHLATVQESFNASNNQFKVRWKRGNDGHGRIETCTLTEASQVRSAVDYGSMVVQVECDVNGKSHSAKIVDLLDGSSGSGVDRSDGGRGDGDDDNGGNNNCRPGEVRIKWWDAGYEEVVNVSQVMFGIRSRRKQRRAVSDAADVTSKKPMGTKRLRAKRANKAAVANSGKRKKGTMNRKSDDGGEKQIISLLSSSSSSSSSSEEDEGGESRRKPRRWNLNEHLRNLNASKSSCNHDVARPAAADAATSRKNEENEKEEDCNNNDISINEQKKATTAAAATATAPDNNGQPDERQVEVQEVDLDEDDELRRHRNDWRRHQCPQEGEEFMVPAPEEEEEVCDDDNIETGRNDAAIPAFSGRNEEEGADSNNGGIDEQEQDGRVGCSNDAFVIPTATGRLFSNGDDRSNQVHCDGRSGSNAAEGPARGREKKKKSLANSSNPSDESNAEEVAPKKKMGASSSGSSSDQSGVYSREGGSLVTASAGSSSPLSNTNNEMTVASSLSSLSQKGEKKKKSLASSQEEEAYDKSSSSSSPSSYSLPSYESSDAEEEAARWTPTTTGGAADSSSPYPSEDESDDNKDEEASSSASNSNSIATQEEESEGDGNENSSSFYYNHDESRNKVAVATAAASSSKKRVVQESSITSTTSTSSSSSGSPDDNDNDEGEDEDEDISSDNDCRIIGTTQGTTARRVLRKRKSPPDTATPSSSSNDTKINNDKKNNKMELIHRRSRKRANAVTPQKKTTTNNSSPSSSEADENVDENEEEEGATATKMSTSSRRIMMHGFCHTIPTVKDNPKNTIELVKTMLDKAHECVKEGEGEEYKEILVDGIMLLQESLYNLGERTKIITTAPASASPSLENNAKYNPSSDNTSKKKNENDEKNNNKGHILRLAKQFHLTNQQMNELFSIHLDVSMEGGFYSLDDAIPIIMGMKQTNEEEESSSSDEEDDDDDDGGEKTAAAGADAADAAESESANNNNGQNKNAQPQLLGSRVKTVFDDGQEFEGTIEATHYRVVYDDKDTETYLSEAEAFENLLDNEKVLSNDCEDGLRCSMVEIFSGCSLLSTLCKRKGMIVTSVDNDPDSNATIKDDFSSPYVQSMLSSKIHDYIHGSPVCSTHSLMAQGKHRDKFNYNKTPASHEADSMLMTFYFFVADALKRNEDATVTIENPGRGWMRKGNIMKELFERELGFKSYDIYYCQFGRADQKPTKIWTNDHNLGHILETIGGKCNCRLPHAESANGRYGSSSQNFAALPMKLCQIISSFVHSKHTQLKFKKMASNGC